MRWIGVLILVSGLAMAQTAPSQDATPQADDDAGVLTVPAGTKVPLVLKHAISTKSARPGDPVYLQTSFPVAQNNRILIPAGTYVQGVIDKVQRPGRVKGRAELLMHFTTLIFPNGHTVSIPGGLENVPGQETSHIKGKEGTIESDSQKGQDTATVASTAGAGAVIGGLARGSGKGAAIGGGVGAAAGLAAVLLSRGDEVRLQPGTTVEMIFNRPLKLEMDRLSNASRDAAPVDRDRRLDRRVLTPPANQR